MTGDFNRIEQRLSSIEQRLEEGFSRPASRVLDEVLGLEQRTNERLDRLTERVERLAENQQVMQAAIGNLAQVMAQIVQDAAADRAVMREMQTEVRGLQVENHRILARLFGEQPG